MNFRNINLKAYKHFLACSIFLVLVLWFEYLKKTIVPIYIMWSPMDDKIPFLKGFILPYFAWFPYMAVAFIYLGLISKKDYYRLLAFLALNMSISYIIYMIFPNGQFARPTVVGNDIFANLVRYLYSICETNNVCPSIHVANSIGVHVAIISCSKLKDKHLLKWASFILMLLISASTVFVKQHSILDVFAGVLLSGVIYLVVYQLPKLFAKEALSSDTNLSA
jgi:membrane-associated phospholipid phosphatase